MPTEYTPAQVERFWSRVVQSTDADACWSWNGTHNSDGYGQMKIGRRMVKAHRLAWEIANDEMLGTRKGRHKCDNPGCCNPAHVIPGTQIDNIRDMDERGRRSGRCMTAAEYAALRVCPSCGGPKKGRSQMCQACRIAVAQAGSRYVCPSCGGRKHYSSRRCGSCRWPSRQHQ